MVETTGESEGPPPKESPGVTEISRQAVEELGAKLDEFAARLTHAEQITLATAFALASRGFLTFPSGVACERGLRVSVGQSAIVVERLAGPATPKLSDALVGAFCPGSASSFSIEGLEVEKPMMPMMGAKSVAAACRNLGFAGAKSVAAAACRNPGLAGAKSVAAAACRNPGLAGAKSVAAAACRNLGFAGAKSVAAAACRNPGLAGAKSVAAAACRNLGFAGAKSVAAAACRNLGFAGAKSVAAACRMPGMLG